MTHLETSFCVHLLQLFAQRVNLFSVRAETVVQISLSVLVALGILVLLVAGNGILVLAHEGCALVVCLQD